MDQMSVDILLFAVCSLDHKVVVNLTDVYFTICTAQVQLFVVLSVLLSLRQLNVTASMSCVMQLRQLQDRQASLLRLQRESERRLEDRRDGVPSNRADQRLADGPATAAAAAAGVDMATEV